MAVWKRSVVLRFASIAGAVLVLLVAGCGMDSGREVTVEGGRDTAGSFTSD